MTLEIRDSIVFSTCYVPRTRPTSGTGAESTDDAEHKSDLPYMAGPRTDAVTRSLTSSATGNVGKIPPLLF
jgi:hypothetical protein